MSEAKLQHITPPEVVDSPEQRTAMVHLVTPRDRIQEVMGPALSELQSALRAQGITPSGPWFAHHLRRPTDVFDFEVSLPVSRSVEPVGRVENGTIRATRVARTLYRGAYEVLPAAWREFIAWVEASGHTMQGDLWEVYTVSPADSPLPSAWTTELNVPLGD